MPMEPAHTATASLESKTAEFYSHSKIQDITNKPKILAVDDDKGILELIKVKFRKDYEIITASSSHEAESILEKNSVDLMLLDIGLPDESGLSFRKRTKEKYDVPVIFFTGLDESGLEDQSLELGAFDYVQKPLEQNLLVQKIKNITQKLDSDKSFHFMNIVFPSYIAKQNGGIQEDMSHYKFTKMHEEFREKFGINPSKMIGKSHKDLFESLGISELDIKTFYDSLHSRGKVFKQLVYANNSFLELNAKFPAGRRSEFQGMINDVSEEKRKDIKNTIHALTNRQLNEFSHSTNILDLEQILDRTFYQTMNLFDAERCSIFLYNCEFNEFELKRSTHLNERKKIKIKYEPDKKSVMMMALASAKSLISIKPSDFNRLNLPYRREHKDATFVTIPLRVGEFTPDKKGDSELLGIINLTYINIDKTFQKIGYPAILFNNPIYENLIRKTFQYKADMVAGDIGTKISNAQHTLKLKRLADTDYLTGLHTHRYFQENLEKEFNLSKRYNSPFSLIYADIDHFKKVNDTYGHAVGDGILKLIGAIFRDTARDTDICCRPGGEELAIILPHTNKKGAYEIAERVRENIANFDYSAKKLPSVTISCGVSTYSNKFQSRQELLKLTDRALYKAKNSGRNKVVCI